MASQLGFIEFLCEQIADCGSVTFKKMFGEYMVYLNEKPIFLVCDDTLFVKILPASSAVLGENAETGCPYAGAKPHYVVTDVENRELLSLLAIKVERVTPLPKKKIKKPL